MKSFYIMTFGCKVNSYESESVREMLENKGYVRVANFKDADIVVFNTCAVTRVSEKKCLTKIRSISAKYPSKTLACFGCYAQLHPEEILENAKVHVLVGSSNKHLIADYLEEYFNTGKTTVNVEKNLRKTFYERIGITHFLSEARAFVKIQDGCDNFCSYCVIPLTRGVSRSRPHEDILKEIKELALNDYREIVLTGVDMGSYDDGENYKLSELINDILEVEPKTFRVRIGSLEASQINEKIIDTYATNPRLVPHIHIPLQSGCERILELMGRKYDLNEFYNLTVELKNKIPHLALSTDVIVGFPTETDEEYKITEDFIKKVGFMRLHVFPYSARPYTKAAQMKGQVRRDVAKKRVNMLTEVGEELGKEYYESNLGKTLSVLVEEELFRNGKVKFYRGYTENYLDVKVKSEDDLIGKIVDIKLSNDDVQEIIK